MNDHAAHLIRNLEQEIAWVEALNTLLSEEKVILATRQFEQLEEFADKKNQLSMQLETSSNERLALSQRDQLAAFNAEETTRISQLNNQLAEKLALCRDLNTINGQVIATNLHTRQQLVDLLSNNTTKAAEVYTATGDLQSAASSGLHHQEA